MQEMWVRPLTQEDPLEEGNGNPPQYSCLESLMDRGAWQAAFHEISRVELDFVTEQQLKSLQLLFLGLKKN